MKYFFSTSNYGTYFYLIGSLIFFFQSLKSDKMEFTNTLLILAIFIIIAIIFVYGVIPLHKKSSS